METLTLPLRVRIPLLRGNGSLYKLYFSVRFAYVMFSAFQARESLWSNLKKGLLLCGNLYLQWVTSCVRLKDLKLQLLYMFFFASVVYRTCFLLVCHGFDRSFIFPVGVRMWEIGRSFDFVAAGAETSGIVVWIKLVFLKFFVSFWASIYGVYYVLY